jgi:hypothetical protein
MTGNDRIRWGGQAVIGVGIALALAGLYSGQVGLLLVGLGLAVGGFVLSRAGTTTKAAHVAQVQSFASQHGWTHHGFSTQYVQALRGFPFEGKTRGHHEDVLAGTYGGHSCAVLTHVVPQSGDDARATQPDAVFQITVVEVPVLLPRIDLIPEDSFTKLAAAIGGQDVTFESYAFNRKWRVKAAELRSTYDVLDPRMIRHLETAEPHEVNIRIDGGVIYEWRVGRHGTDDLASRLNTLTGMASRLAPHLVRSLQERGAVPLHADDPGVPIKGPTWATTPGVLNSGRYTGIGVDADGDGVEDWKQDRPNPGQRPPDPVT